MSAHIKVNGVSLCQYMDPRLRSDELRLVTCGQDSLAEARDEAEKLVKAGILGVEAVEGRCDQRQGPDFFTHGDW